MAAPRVTPGPFLGLWIVDLDVIEDPERPGASFREVWRSEVTEALGLPPLGPVQWSVSETVQGTIRGLHAEPWDKLVHAIAGEVFAAIADLRAGSPTAGQVWTGSLDRTRALFVSRGLGNGFQATSDVAVYGYLVNGTWEPGVRYPAVRWDDPDLAIAWPITDERLVLSGKDRANPTLREALAAGGA
jgi:dTDP-4-dehydrorhamnose 3,5-epimerase